MSIQSFRYFTNPGGAPWVAIANNDTEVMYPFSWWTLQEPGYSLPSPYIYDEYVKGQYHRYFTSIDQFAAEYPWANGDIYIGKKATYDAAYALYIGTPASLEIAIEEKLRDLAAELFTKQAGMVVYDTANYLSDETTYARLFSQDYLFTGLTAVPVGYYILDEDRNEVASDLADLQAIVVLIQQLHYACTLSYDIHYAAISALGNITDVQNYDLTTGWPTVPYV